MKTPINPYSTARREPVIIEWLGMMIIAVVVASLILLLFSGCNFLDSNAAKVSASTPIHIRPVKGTGWVGDTYSHDNWIELCKTHGPDARPANPDANVGWTALGNGYWVISEEAYNQYMNMDQAAYVNPGLYMAPSTNK